LSPYSLKSSFRITNAFQKGTEKDGSSSLERKSRCCVL
jgi:hypothetical protein